VTELSVLNGEVVEGVLEAKFGSPPQLPKDFVPRDHYVESLRDLLFNDDLIVFVEADQGAGRSILLSHFCRTYPQNTFSLFIKATSKISYSLEYLTQLLAEQFWMYVSESPVPETPFDEGALRRLVLQVRKRSRGSRLFVVVDGLHQVPLDDARQIIAELLPIGVENFSFLISGSDDALSQYVEGVRSKSFTIPKFGDYEAEAYLSDVVLTSSQREQVKRLCRGNIGNLASFKRLVASGRTADEVLSADIEQHLDFVKLEFSALPSLDSGVKLLLAVLGQSKQELTWKELTSIVKSVDAPGLRAYCSELPFLLEDPDTLIFSFTSEAHRAIAVGMLEDYRERALNLLIDYLAANPGSPIALQFLPTYYRLMGQRKEIVSCISADHYDSLLKHTQSISALRGRASLGVRAASELRDAVDVYRFSMERSIFGALMATEDLQAEVGALAALGKDDKALDVAINAPTHEARISLLAEYCRRVREREGTVDPQITDYIGEVARSVNFDELGDAAISIAENLIFVMPDLALSILDTAMRSGRAKDKSRNEVLARLSFAASMGQRDGEEQGDRITSEISDERLQKLLSSLRSVVDQSSTKQVLTLASGMKIGQRMQFLRWVIGLCGDEKNAAEVVSYALDQLVANSEYVPKAVDLADLAAPLRLIGDEGLRMSLLRRIEGQIPLIERSSPSKDLTLLQMRLAHAEYSVSLDRCSARMNDAYFDVDNIGSVETKVDCLAIMLSALDDVDVDRKLEESDGFSDVFRIDLLANIDALICDSANQGRVLKRSIHSLATYSVSQALEVVNRLNSSMSRDDARVNVINAACKRPWSSALESEINAAISAIEDYNTRDLALAAAARAVVTAKSPLQWSAFLRKLPLRARDPHFVCSIAIDVLDFAVAEQPEESIDDLMNIFNSAVESIDSLFSRVEYQYLLVPILAKKDFGVAESVYEKALVLNRSETLGKRAVADVVAHCLALMTRAFRPLMKYGAVTKADLDRMYRLCDAIPCSSTRVNIYTDLATRFWCERRTDECKAVVKDKIRPLISGSDVGSEADTAAIVAIAAPALYVAHAVTALQEFDTLSPQQKASAFYRTGRMMLSRKSTGEPSQELEEARVIPDHEDLMDLLALLDNVNDDWLLWALIEPACRAISSRDNKTRLTGQQRRDFAIRAQDLAQAKLPDLKNVRHDGYLIVCLAQTMRILEAKQPEWDQLILRAKAVSNRADRAYVLIEVSKCLPARMLDLRKQLLADARSLIDELPASYDKYTRLENYIRAVREVAPALAKTALRDALKISLDSGHRDVDSRWRRNLVDLADVVSADLSQMVSELSDEDPARLEMKKRFDRDIAIQGIRKRLGDEDAEKVQQSSASDLSDAAQRNLCSLVSGRMQAKEPKKMIGALVQAGDMYLPDSYPVLAWYIENAASRCMRDVDAESRIRPLLEVIMLSSEIALSTASRIGSSRSRASIPASGLASESALIVRPGHRQEAMDFMRFWLRSNSSDSVVICDAYFSSGDCEFLQLVLAECPDAQVTVLTSLKAVEGIDFDRESFLAQWRMMSDDEPPATEIIAMAGYDNKGQILIHDRWLISGMAALRLGTSFNSLGIGKLSEISPVLSNECPAVLEEVLKYKNKSRLVNSVRAQYKSVTL